MLTQISTVVLSGLFIIQSFFSLPSSNNIYIYQFKLADVTLPGHAKMANTHFIRDYFHSVAEFSDETDVLSIRSELDITQADLQQVASPSGYSITSFSKSLVE